MNGHPKLERRAQPAPIALRDSGPRGRMISGLAVPFGRYSRDRGGFVELIDEGAFSDSRGRGWPNVTARYAHIDSLVLGTAHLEDRSVATLRLHVDRTGLHYEIDPPRTRADVVELIERGDIRAAGLAFITHRDRWTTTPDGYPLRVLESIQLTDLALVPGPGVYVDSSIALRSLAIAADADFLEVRKLADAGELKRLFRASRPNPVKRGPLLGAAAREQLDRLATAKGTG